MTIKPESWKPGDRVQQDGVDAELGFAIQGIVVAIGPFMFQAEYGLPKNLPDGLVPVVLRRLERQSIGVNG